LLKEIREIFNLSDDYKLINLMKALSLQVGNLINYEELSKISGFSYAELKKYLNILEKTFVLKLIKPFFSNKRTEIVKNPKVYFFDLGFRNIIIDNFQKERTDKGAIYENFVFLQITYSGKELKFWNTKSSAEVDFILEKEGEIIPLEVKSFLTNNKITKSFRSFIEKYPIKKGYFFSEIFEGNKKINKTKINFIPFVLLNPHKL
jgi:hypothetical protein